MVNDREFDETQAVLGTMVVLVFISLIGTGLYAMWDAYSTQNLVSEYYMTQPETHHIIPRWDGNCPRILK